MYFLFQFVIVFAAFLAFTTAKPVFEHVAVSYAAPGYHAYSTGYPYAYSDYAPHFYGARSIYGHAGFYPSAYYY